MTESQPAEYVTESQPADSMSETQPKEEVTVDSDLDSDNEESKVQTTDNTEETTEIVYEKLNSESIWMKSPSEVSQDEYERFYEQLANTKVPFKFKLHYSTDVPLAIKSLLYFPS